jgi:hypothetical protein
VSWSRELPHAIALNDGRTIATLDDACSLMLTLPERMQRNKHWRYAGELLLVAAKNKQAVGAARVQLAVALRAEGLI